MVGRVVEEPDDSSGDSDDFDYEHLGRLAGSMDLIQRTLNGISSRSEDNGVEAIGRHAAVIQMGRDIWQSAPLTAAAAAGSRGTIFIRPRSSWGKGTLCEYNGGRHAFTVWSRPHTDANRHGLFPYY